VAVARVQSSHDRRGDAINFHIDFLCAPALIPHRGAEEAPAMTDIVVIALGTASILLMAAYAELCERI
jgi:hypothetical protein